MIDLLKQLCRQNGVSGDEDAIRAFIREQAAPYADSIRTDALGNLIVCKKGRRSDGPKLLLCAHMDEVGIIVTHVTDEGFLKFGFVGGVDRRVAIGKPVALRSRAAVGIQFYFFGRGFLELLVILIPQAAFVFLGGGKGGARFGGLAIGGVPGGRVFGGGGAA